MCWPVGKAERKFAGVTHVDVTSFTQAQADDVWAKAHEHGVGISGLGYYPNPLDPDPAVAKKSVDHLKKVMLAAEKLGLKNVNTFVGRDWTKTIDENWPRFLKTWKPLIAFAEDHDIKIGIENCPMFFSRDEWPGGKNLATSPVDLAADVQRHSQRPLRSQLRSLALHPPVHGPGVAVGANSRTSCSTCTRRMSASAGNA